MGRNIAVLLTCFNRKEKTLSCLASLFNAQDGYNKCSLSNQVQLTLFLVDDGCTDGTSDAIKKTFSNKKINIIKGTGSLYWAGGMRLAWRTALMYDNWDYFLLINDDTDLLEIVFDELFKTEEYSIKHYAKEGLISGITTSKTEPYILTYGGSVWVNKFLGTKKRLGKSASPQLCDFTNANILLIPNSIVNQVGIFFDGYIHGLADYDYSNMVRKAGFPVILTANFCGRCDRDHSNHAEIHNRVVNMSLMERKKYFKDPRHSLDQYYLYARRVTPLRAPFVRIANFLHVYFPVLLYKMGSFRF